MRMSKRLVIGGSLAALAVATASLPAYAGDTAATFTLAGNASGLSIAVPDGSVTPIDLGSASTGATSLAGQLGTVTVTDTRGALSATWTATVSSTDFTNATTGGTSAGETVANSAISYASGLSTNLLSGQVGTFAPQAGAALGTAQTAGSWAGVGNNTVSWNPTLTFTLLTSQVAGTYAGTVTHSVS